MKDFYHPDELQPKTTPLEAIGMILMGLAILGLPFIFILRFFYII